MIGGLAEATDGLRLHTGVTCPIIRIHPAIVAHAAATCAGYDHVFVHQIGPEQEAFFRFNESEILARV